MIDEAIKKATEASQRLESALDLVTLPLISQFMVLKFSGLADGNPLTRNFDLNRILGKIIVIKSIKIVPYTNGDFIDLNLIGTGDTFTETIPTNVRINRLFEVYDFGCTVRLSINGAETPIFTPSTPIFPPASDGNAWIDMDIDNIYYKYPSKLQDLGFSVRAQVASDITPGGVVYTNPNVNVFLQCYIF